MRDALEAVPTSHERAEGASNGAIALEVNGTKLLIGDFVNTVVSS